MSIKPLIQQLSFTLIIFLFLSLHLTSHANAKDFGDEDFPGGFGPWMKKEQRKTLVDNEYGQISAVDITDGIRGPHHIQFFTLEPNALFLPVLLHAEMVFYVHTGSGKLNWANEEEKRRVTLRRGDIFRLGPGSVFYLQSDLEPERESLRIYAIFPNTDDDESFEPEFGAYSSIRNLVRGFDKITLKRAFKAPDEVIESITSATDQQAIVHAISTKKEKKKKGLWEMEARFLKAFLGGKEDTGYNKKKKETKLFNILDADPDFENCNGWSLTVTRRKAAQLLSDTDIGLFMVNLTKGSMMGPHWNPKATEIAIVLQGQGMVRVVCSSSESVWKSECKNTRFRVKEGDVFAVPRFHPMAQMSFNNDSLVFMGFSTKGENNHPQFLAGKQSVLKTLDRDVLAMSFNVSNTTINQLLAPQADSIILDCTSCAEEEERMMEEEIEKEREEEEEKKREEEEEARRREEERKREKEEEKRREEEEERKREEEEARKREEEEEKRREEEEEQKREEEEARKREEEEEEKRREEEEARKREEEEEKRKREEEEARKREEEEEEREREQEEARRQEERQREQEEARRQEEERQREREERRQEEERQRQEEEERERQQEEQEKQWEQEKARRQEEERERQREEQERQEEETSQRKQEEARRREEETRQRGQEEARRREEERRQEEERQRQEQEEERVKQQEEQEAARRRQEDRERERQQPEATRKQEPESEQEAARRQAEEREQRKRQEEEEETRKEREKREEERRPENETGREPEDQDAETPREKQGGDGDNGRAYLKLWTV